MILPLYDICSALRNDLTKCLPAVHALTGCDTTSKIATKSATLNTVQKLGNSIDFISPQVAESSIQMVETFLVRCLKLAADLQTFDDLHLAAFNSNTRPEVVISKPEGLPAPCTCCKCAHKNGCCCRVAGIECCKYCKCKGGDSCQNPITE